MTAIGDYADGQRDQQGERDDSGDESVEQERSKGGEIESVRAVAVGTPTLAASTPASPAARDVERRKAVVWLPPLSATFTPTEYSQTDWERTPSSPCCPGWATSGERTPIVGVRSYPSRYLDIDRELGARAHGVRADGKAVDRER